MGPVPDVKIRAQRTPTTGTRHQGCPSRTRKDQSDGASHTCASRPPTSARSAEFKASVRLHNRSCDEGLVRPTSDREPQDVQAPGHFD